MRRHGPAFDLFVLILDQDGDAHRSARLRSLEERVADSSRPLVCCLAHQEVETWLLAIQWSVCRREHPAWRWSQVREEPDVKQRYFAPFFANHRDLWLPGQGRGRLMQGLNLQALVDKCPEVGQLREAIARRLRARTGVYDPGPAAVAPPTGSPSR